MSILGKLTDTFKPINIPEIRLSDDECKTTPQCEDKTEHEQRENECKPPKADECGEGREAKWNSNYNDHDNSRSDYKDGRNDNYEHKGNSEYNDHDNSHSNYKEARNDNYEHKGNSDYDGHEHSNSDWKSARNEDCETREHESKGNDSCEHQQAHCETKDNYCDPKPADCSSNDCNFGAKLAATDFSQGGPGSYGADHSSEMHGALASMSSGHALDYAIGQMSPTDHFDPGHFDLPADAHASHDVHVA